VASSRTRARKLARAKLNRQLTRRAEQHRRSRQIRAALAVGLALVIAGVGSAWLLGAFDKKPSATPQAQCAWTQQKVSDNADLKDEGTPPVSGLPNTGNGLMTVALNSGSLQVRLDRTGSPCAAASLAYLASKNYFDHTPCFSLTHGDGGYALACGDHTGKGTGGPAYTFYNERLAPPANPAATPAASASAAPQNLALYKKGTVVMSPQISGSQFMIFYKDSTIDSTQHPYSVVGEVVSGLETVETVAKAGTVKNDQGADVKPKSAVTIQTLTVTDAPAEPGGATGSAQPAATPSQS
jgi:peptidyl-prolyl cis-trans isomerase B (cyclophilin B)